MIGLEAEEAVEVVIFLVHHISRDAVLAEIINLQLRVPIFI